LWFNAPMYKPFELFIGLRYTRAKRRNHFISFITFFSVAGIALGVMALITVMSVMNGFHKEVSNRILDMVAHITVTNFDGKLYTPDVVVKQAKKNPHVLAAAPYIDGQGMLIYGSNVNGIIIRGIDPKQELGVSKVATKMETGKLENLVAGKFGIVLGRDLARILGVTLGDKVTMVTPSLNVTPAGVLPRLKRFKVVGTFHVDMHPYDSTMAIINIKDAARLLKKQDNVTGVRLKIDNVLNSQDVRDELQKGVLAGYWVRDWTYSHRNWFRAVEIEKRMIFILLVLIIAVAAFNIISTLIMLVTDKQSDIAILRTFGASPASIMRIFFVQGCVIGVFGTLLGVAGGVLLSLNVGSIVGFFENLLGMRVLDPSVYVISEFPSDLHWNDVSVISMVSLGISLLATLYPAYRASKTQPAEALRYE